MLSSAKILWLTRCSRLASRSPLPRCLAPSRLSDLNKSEQPLEYMRVYVSEINDHQRLERIRNVLVRLSKMKVASLSKTRRDPTPIDLTRFQFLTSLEIYKCDLSTHPVVGLAELRPRLENLVVSNSAEALSHIFAPTCAAATESSTSTSDPSTDDARGEWRRLGTVRCSHNSCSKMDASLTLLTCVRTLDLSGNCFRVMENLHNCVNLVSLDLSCNRISSTARLNERCGNLTYLNLARNSLSSTEGLDKLYSLEVLDISGNLISSYSEVARLGALPCLEGLSLRDNPISYDKEYRLGVLRECSPSLRMLDGAEWTKKEMDKAGSGVGARAETMDPRVTAATEARQAPPPQSKKKVARDGKPKQRGARQTSIAAIVPSSPGGGRGEKPSWMWSSPLPGREQEEGGGQGPGSGSSQANRPRARTGPNASSSPPRWSQDQLIVLQYTRPPEAEDDGDNSSSSSSSSSFGVYSEDDQD